MGSARTPALLIAAAAALALSACGANASRRVAAVRRPSASQANPGAFHTVKAGETLYRIAGAYGVPVEALARENGIDKPAALEVGQRLFVPGARAPIDASLEPQALKRGPQAASREPQAAAASRSALAWPVHGVLFSPFGSRARDRHDGIDLAAPEGTPVVAAESGTVLFAGKKRGYGNLILVGHDGDVVTVYAHNRENLVEVGQRVRRGALIARVGRTGNATGPHLHFEVRIAARPRNPMEFLR